MSFLFFRLTDAIYWCLQNGHRFQNRLAQFEMNQQDCSFKAGQNFDWQILTKTVDNKRSFLSSELLLNYQLEFISEFSFSIKERKPNFSGKQHAKKKHITVKLLQKRREKNANNEETLGKECQIFWKHLKEIYFWMFWWYVIIN